MSEENESAKPSDSSDYTTDESSRSTGSGGYTIDHTYLRSIEGILRMASIVVAVIYLILTLVGYLQAGAWISFFMGVGWIVYAIVVIVIEVFIPNVYVHRLIDAIVTIVWAVLWGIAAIIALAFGIVLSSPVIGISFIFALADAILVGANGFFALRTWRTFEGGRKGSVAIFVI